MQRMVRFGSFEIDTRTWMLTSEGRPVDLSPHLVEILAHLIDASGAIVTKDDLLDRFWPDTSVTENTLTRAIADIRKAIGDDAAKPRYVQTLARRGYRFVGVATTGPEPLRAGSREGGAFQDWVKGRLALESLDESRLASALDAFERAVADLPSYAPAHAGLANACLLRFEATRISGTPDASLMERGVAAARDACRLDPNLGEAWAVLGHLLTISQQVEDARAAARQAAALEPGSWRHQFRLALATWGEERLRAVDRTLTLMPSCAAAHMLASMVFVARGAFDAATASATRGAALQDAQGDGAPLPAAGCWWLMGLLALARGSAGVTDARACFTREVETGEKNGLYGREFAQKARTELQRLSRAADPALPGVPDEAVARMVAMVGTAPPGPAGWSIPIDPATAWLRAHPSFAQVLAVLAARAS